MATNAWANFRNRVINAVTEVGEHGVKTMVAEKLQKQGYDPYEARRVSNTLVNKAQTSQPYDPNDPDMVTVTGYKNNRGMSTTLIAALIAGAGVVLFAVARRR